MNEADKLKILEYAFDYRRGSLWWGAEPFIRERFEKWHMNDRKGHPLLSLREEHVSALYEFVPMLAGTSVKNKKRKHITLPIQVTEEKTTDFGTQTDPILIFADDFIYHSSSKEIENDPLTPIWERRRLWPNLDKTHISQQEDELLQKFLDKLKYAALEQGGYNK